jgi:hypothetical protein
MIWTPDRTIKPGWGTPLDPDHPLNRGLSLHVPFDEGSGPPGSDTPGVRETTLLQDPNSGAWPDWAGSEWGDTFRTTSAVNPGHGVAIPDWGGLATPQYAVRIVHRPNLYTSGYTTLAYKVLVGVGSREFAVFLDTSGNMSYFGIGHAEGGVAIPTGMTVGSIWDFVVTREDTLNKFYVNGIYVGSVSIGNFGQNADPINLGRSDPGGTTYCGEYILFECWRDRFLTDDEVAELHRIRFAPRLAPVRPRAAAVAPPTPVGISGAATWAVHQRIGISANSTWDLAATVGRVGSANWDDRAAVGSAGSAIWAIRQTIGLTAAATWQVRTPARIAANALWSVRGRVGGVYAARWDNRALANLTRSARWTVRGVVGMGVSASWDVMTLIPTWPVGLTGSLAWADRQRVGIAGPARWDVRVPIGINSHTQWNNHNKVGISVIALWGVRGLARRDGTIRFTVFAPAGPGPGAFDPAAAAAYIEAQHGPGPWGLIPAAGAVRIDHDYPQPDAMRAVRGAGPDGIPGVRIRIFSTNDYLSGLRQDPRDVRGRSLTGPDGRWLNSVYLVPGEYIILYEETARFPVADYLVIVGTVPGREPPDLPAGDINSPYYELDSILTAAHGRGPWGPDPLRGPSPVDHHYGGHDQYTITRNGSGLANVTIELYPEADYHAGRAGDRYRIGWSRTDAAGHWNWPVNLYPGRYVAACWHEGIASTFIIEVS